MHIYNQISLSLSIEDAYTDAENQLNKQDFSNDHKTSQYIPFNRVSLQSRRIFLSTASRRESIARHGINTEGRRRDPESRVLAEEVRSTHHNADRLSRHDREVLGTREVSQAELHIADNIGVLDTLISVGPVHDGLVVGVVLLSSRLADVVTSWEELVVLIGDNPESIASEGGTLPDDASGFCKHRRAAAVENLVGNGLLGDFVDFVRVDNIPGAVGFVAVVGCGLQGGAKRGLLAVEAVSVVVLRRTNSVV